MKLNAGVLLFTPEETASGFKATACHPLLYSLSSFLSLSSLLTISCCYRTRVKNGQHRLFSAQLQVVDLSNNTYGSQTQQT